MLLGAVEDSVVDGASALGARFIGRLRNSGFWQTAFMGPAGIESAVRELAANALEGVGRTGSLDYSSDEEWSYYRDFLYPDPERMQWIQDRRVVDALCHQGDDLSKRREVFHFADFEDESSQTAFEAEVIKLGFEAELADEGGVKFYRVDSVELEQIHAVTEQLRQLAQSKGGDYDGWETSVEVSS